VERERARRVDTDDENPEGGRRALLTDAVASVVGPGLEPELELAL